MEDEEIIDPRKKKLEERKAAIAAKNAALIAKRKAAAKSREDALSEREIAAKERARLLKEKAEARIAQREAFAQKRKDEIQTKKDEVLSIRKAKIDRDNETKQLATDFDAEEAKRRALNIAEKAKDDNYDWKYIGGDESTANERQRTEIIEGEKEVEKIIQETKTINDFNPEGKKLPKFRVAWNNIPQGEKDRKYPGPNGFIQFKKEALQYIADQTKTITEDKVIKEIVPTREEKVITQTREDWIKTQHWAEGLPKGLISKLAIQMRKRGGDMTPKELYNIFKSQTSEAESAKWARANGYGYLLGGGGRRGSTTSRGKTNFN